LGQNGLWAGPAVLHLWAESQPITVLLVFLFFLFSLIFSKIVANF
jgi:hypothetical protein